MLDHRDDSGTLANAAMALSVLARRHDEALHAIERALALNPNSAWVAFTAGWIRQFAGQAAASIEHFQRAIRLSPLDPATSHFLTGLGFAYTRIGKFDDALSAGLRALHASPDDNSSHRLVIVCLVGLGRLDEARAGAQRLLALSPGLTITKWRALTAVGVISRTQTATWPHSVSPAFRIDWAGSGLPARANEAKVAGSGTTAVLSIATLPAQRLGWRQLEVGLPSGWVQPRRGGAPS